VNERGANSQGGHGFDSRQLHSISSPVLETGLFLSHRFDGAEATGAPALEFLRWGGAAALGAEGVLLRSRLNGFGPLLKGGPRVLRPRRGCRTLEPRRGPTGELPEGGDAGSGLPSLLPLSGRKLDVDEGRTQALIEFFQDQVALKGKILGPNRAGGSHPQDSLPGDRERAGLRSHD